MTQPTWIGQTLGRRYKIEALLGQGGMSAVYKATDPNLRRQVAIKLIHPHLATTQEFVSRFEEEAAAVAQLRHPNIIQVYDFSHDNNVYYMVLEFLPGESLEQRLRRLNGARQRMPLGEITGTMVKICQAVGYAHSRGMIHRDLKPANVMIMPTGEPILMDFGIVKMLGGDTQTATGGLIGTVAYMAPEQIRGERADPRTDIYALGVMLFEMISGQRPFQGDSAPATMMMHLTQPVPDIRTLNQETPPALVGIVEKALAKSPADRFQSTHEMAAALQTVSLTGSMAATRLDGPTAIQQPRTIEQQRPPLPTPMTPAPMPRPAAPPQPAQPAAGGPPRWLVAGGVAGALLLILVLCVTAAALGSQFLDGSGFGGDTATPTRPIFVAEVTDVPAITTAPATVASEEIAVTEPASPTTLPAAATTAPATATTAPPAASEAPPATPTTLPTASPTAFATPTALPSPTLQPTPAGPTALITGITLNGSQYQIAFTTAGFNYGLPGTHVHFFFDTVTPAQAGVPGSGPWKLYGGPSPFTEYTTADRPPGATRMCILVANADHSVQLNTGNCVALP
jgi:hypothetical protein